MFIRLLMILLTVVSTELSANQAPAPYEKSLSQAVRSFITAPFTQPSATQQYEEAHKKLLQEHMACAPESFKPYYEAHELLKKQLDVQRDIEAMKHAIRQSALMATYLPSFALVGQMICTRPCVAKTDWAKAIRSSSCMRFLMRPTSFFSVGLVGMLAQAGYEGGRLGYTFAPDKPTSLHEQFYW